MDSNIHSKSGEYKTTISELTNGDVGGFVYVGIDSEENFFIRFDGELSDHVKELVESVTRDYFCKPLN